jgi:hypothetical protein
MVAEQFAPFAEVDKAVERDERSARRPGLLEWPDADPVDLLGDPALPGLVASPSDPDNGLVVPPAHASHGVVNAEAPLLIGIAVVGPLVDEGPNWWPHCHGLFAAMNSGDCFSNQDRNRGGSRRTVAPRSAG